MKTSSRDLCFRVSVAVKGLYDHGNYYKEKHLIWAAFELKGLVHYCDEGSMARSIGGIGADMVLEK